MRLGLTGCTSTPVFALGELAAVFSVYTPRPLSAAEARTVGRLGTGDRFARRARCRGVVQERAGDRRRRGRHKEWLTCTRPSRRRSPGDRVRAAAAGARARLGAAVLAAVTLGACTPGGQTPASERPSRDHTLVTSIRAEPRSFNRYLARDLSTEVVTQLMQASLVRVNRVTQQLEPRLAERWELLPDQVTYRLHLRPGIQFSDGHPFSSADVVFSFRAIYDPAVASVLGRHADGRRQAADRDRDRCRYGRRSAFRRRSAPGCGCWMACRCCPDIF